MSMKDPYPPDEDQGNDRPVGVRMSLRDYFAGQAMLMFHVSKGDLLMMQGGKHPAHYQVAQFAYALADAMLDIREEERNG